MDDGRVKLIAGAAEKSTGSRNLTQRKSIIRCEATSILYAVNADAPARTLTAFPRAATSNRKAISGPLAMLALGLLVASESFSQTVDIEKHFAYVQTDSEIDAFEITESGDLISLAGVSSTPSSLTVHPSLPVIYESIVGSADFGAYSIGDEGLLTGIGTYSGFVQTPKLFVHPSGDFLYLLDPAASYIKVFHVNPDGILHSPHIEDIFIACWNMALHPSGSHTYLKGNSSHLNTFSLDGVAGGLQLVSTTLVNFGIQRLILDSNGNHLRAIKANGGIDTYPIDSSHLIVDTPTTTPSLGGLATLTQHNARYFAVNLLTDSLDRYLIQRDGSLLHELSYALSGTGLRDFAIHPNGEYAYATFESSSAIESFAIDAGGNLTGLGNFATAAGPSQIVLAAKIVTVADCNGNGLPDMDEGLPDCNGNLEADACDLLQGTSVDCNLNGIPDECESPDCPAALVLFDINNGGLFSTGGPYAITASTGQHGGIGLLSSEDYELRDGFWHALAGVCGECRLFGDVISQFCLVDVDDLLCVLDDFTDPGACPGNGDVITSGGACVADGIIDVDDLLAILDAFAGTYACPHPCPS